MRKKPASRKEMLECVNADDLLTSVLTGHHCLDEILATAVSDQLPVPHAVEVEDLSFGLKTDLAIGLGVLPPRARGAFVRFNKARNAFAHSRAYKFTQKDATDLVNAMDPVQRTMLEKLVPRSPEDVLRYTIAVLYVLLRGRIEQARDQKAADAELAKIVKELAETSPFRSREDSITTARMSAAIEASRAKRKADGEP